MEDKKYQDEFEQFLQDEVKQHRMYPADHVWNNIRTEMHGYRAWPALTFISLFIITALTISTILNTQHQQVHLQPISTPNVQLLQEQHQAANKAAAEKTQHYFNALAKAGTEIVNNVLATAELPVSNTPAMETGDIISNSTPRTASVNTILSDNKVRFSPVLAINIPVSPENTKVTVEDIAADHQTDEVETNTNTELKKAVSLNDMSDNDPNADPFLEHFNHVAEQNRKLNRKPSKFGFQFYITPSSSYRKLSDEKVKEVIQPAINATSANPAPLTATGNINQVVRHKAAMGLELGFGAMYNISNRLKFKTGVQLNIRQYQIETFRSVSYDRATISLINFRGVENIIRYSPYNNNLGYREATLNNKVYQLSIPLGLQWEFLKGKHWSINSEASIQPTLNLNKDVYLLSTDYKHYAEGNDFVRRWNINTSVGFNISYTSGKTSWQIGPQVRYQHLSTYSNKYPIREHLMDYGLRIGFTKALQ